MKKTILIICICFCLTSCESDDLSIEKTLIIASQKADCEGFIPQQCFLIKENETQNWQYFYDTIDGFIYEEGFEYKIIVSEREIENPPQDASSIATTLVEITSKIKKESENLPI